MMPEPDLLFFIAALFSEIVGTMAGFGSSTIFLPITLFFFDFRTALILVAIFHMSGNIGRITFFRHGFNKARFLCTANTKEYSAWRQYLWPWISPGYLSTWQVGICPKNITILSPSFFLWPSQGRLSVKGLYPECRRRSSGPSCSSVSDWWV